MTFRTNSNRMDKRIYVHYRRILEIIGTDEYSDMYSKIGAIQATLNKINDMERE